MKTFFIEIAANPHSSTLIPGTIYLSGVVSAKDVEQAKEIVCDYYKLFNIEGGKFKVQCAWRHDMPTRELIEIRWRKYLRSTCVRFDKDSEGNTIRAHSWHSNKNKKDVMETYDLLNVTWDDVFYDPLRRGYSVTVQGYMEMPCEIAFFKGGTKEVYKKAKQFVKDNTFKGEVYRYNLSSHQELLSSLKPLK